MFIKKKKKTPIYIDFIKCISHQNISKTYMQATQNFQVGTK